MSNFYFKLQFAIVLQYANFNYLMTNYAMFYMQCVVPENIHTPTTEGIGNSEGEGGSKTQEIPEGRGVV